MREVKKGIFHVGKRKAGMILTGILFLFFILIWKSAGIYFETNDDKFIAEILSGAVTGEPDGHVVYINYLLSYLLSLLYQIWPGVPWYGVFLVLCHFLMYLALLQTIYNRSECFMEQIIMVGLVGCYGLTHIYMLIAIQYTSTAALMATMGYICLLLLRNDRRKQVFFFGFELIAFLLRPQAMLMVQPIGAMAWMGTCLAEKTGNIKKKGKRATRILPAIGVILIVGYAGTLAGYYGEEWKEYKEFKNARTSLFDYYGNPDYNEVKVLLDQYNVTENEYAAFCNQAMIDGDIKIECIKKLAEFAEERQRRSINARALLEQIAENYSQTDYMGLKQVAGIAWWAALLWTVLLRRWYLALPLTGMAFGRTVIWGYLLYGGRLPFRVTLPLYSCEIFILVSLLILDYTESKKQAGMEKPLGFLFCFVFLIFCIWTGKMQYYGGKEAKLWQSAYMEGLVEVQEYCNRNLEKRYLLDTMSFYYYTGSAFETRIYKKNNYMYSGGWFTNTPIRRRYLQEYFSGYEDDFYLIVYDDGSREEYYAVKYFSEKAGVPPTLVDEITVSHGGVYLVWHFDGQQ